MRRAGLAGKKFLWLILMLLLGVSGSALAANCSNIFASANGINPNLSTNSQLDLSSVSWANNAWPGGFNLWWTNVSGGFGSDSYHFAGDSLPSGYEFDVQPGARVVIYVNGNLNIGNKSLFNVNGLPDQLVLVVKGSVSIGSNVQINGLIYASGSIRTKGSDTINGAMAAAGSISSNIQSTNFEKLYVQGGAWGQLCSRCQNNGLAGSYYNNYASNQPFPSGTPDLTRIDPQIDFNWGSGSPDSSINNNGFGVQWEGSLVAPESGYYYFATYTDDGARLWVGDLGPAHPIINYWHDQSARVHWSSAIYLEKGQRYPVRMQYYENRGVAQAWLYWQTPSGGSATVIPSQDLYGCLPSASPELASTAVDCTNHSVINLQFKQTGASSSLDPVSATKTRNYQIVDTSSGKNYNVTSAILDSTGYLVTLQTNKALPTTGSYQLTLQNILDVNGLTLYPNPTQSNFLVGSSGLVAHYWNNKTLSGSSVYAQITSEIQNNWGYEKSPVPGVVNKDSFSVRWDGYITAPKTGQYVFSMGTDDGGRLYLTNMSSPIINAWHLQSITYHQSQPITLNKGQTYQIRMEMFENKGYASAYLDWNTPGSNSFVPVPGTVLSVCPGGSGIDHFSINAAGTASVCAPTSVTITAQDAGGNTVNGYTGTVNLSTSSAHGNWSLSTSAQGGLSPSPDSNDDGQASYTFASGDNGQVQLNLSNSHADQLTVSGTDASAGASGTSGTIAFARDALVIKNNDPLGQDFIAGRPHQILAQVWQQDPSNSQQCSLMSAYNGSIGLKAWITRSASDPGGAAPGLAQQATQSGQSMPNSQPGANNVSLSFSSGQASFYWQTSDVGQYSLNLLDDSSGEIVDTQGNPIPLLGTSPQWTVRPFGFAISVPGNPAAPDSSGSAFKAAGRDFTVNVTAVRYDTADDSNGDGLPDGYADQDPGNNANLNDNSPTPSFQGSPTLSGYLVSGPTSAADPGLQGSLALSGFSNGTATATVNYPEVGSIEIAADNGGSYLGRQATIQGRSGYVGRFYPDHFGVTVANNGSYQPYCGSFAYTGQDFSYQIAPQLTITPYAYAASGSAPITSNYRSGWQKLTAGEVVLNYPVQDKSQTGADGSTLLAVTDTPASGVLTALGGGRMSYFPGADQFHYNKVANALVAPFTTDLPIPVQQVTDADGVAASTLPTLAPTSIQMRYGRLEINNAYGPETENLEVPFEAQYYDGNNFVTNTDDDCWSYDTSTVTLNPASLSSVNPASATLNQGKPASGKELWLNAPGAGNTGQINLNWVVPDWLQYDWNGDGSLNNPSALATFGVYRGNDRIIYWREVNQ